ncbi:MAG: FAD:protein FMN transferase [Pseudomonadota bacterium]
MSITRRSLLMAPFVLAACKFEQDLLQVTGSTMGTYYKVTAVGVPGSITQSKMGNLIEKSLGEANRRLSNWDANSEISQFNASQSTDNIVMSPVLAKVMNAAARVNELSLGRFDTTLTPLIELWGFGAKGPVGTKPSGAQIAAAMKQSGHQNNLSITANTVKKKNPKAQVFLSAIGKGFGVDLIARSLESAGIQNYLIEIGGDLYAKGHNEKGQPWRVGVEIPRATGSGVMEIVGISNLGMASSGDYRNYFEQNGVRYSHLLDPITGMPISHHSASATVLAEDGMLADAWATAMLILGRKEGMKIADENNIAVMFIDRDFDNGPGRFTAHKNALFEALQA